MSESGSKGNASKKDLAEAGKRKLEAFRKQRAAGRAAASPAKPHVSSEATPPVAPPLTLSTKQDVHTLILADRNMQPTANGATLVAQQLPVASPTNSPPRPDPTHVGENDSRNASASTSYSQATVAPSLGATVNSSIPPPSTAAASQPAAMTGSVVSAVSSAPTSTAASLLEQYRTRPPPRPPPIQGRTTAPSSPQRRHQVSSIGPMAASALTSQAAASVPGPPVTSPQKPTNALWANGLVGGNGDVPNGTSSGQWSSDPSRGLPSSDSHSGSDNKAHRDAPAHAAATTGTARPVSGPAVGSESRADAAASLVSTQPSDPAQGGEKHLGYQQAAAVGPPLNDAGVGGAQGGTAVQGALGAKPWWGQSAGLQKGSASSSYAALADAYAGEKGAENSNVRIGIGSAAAPPAKPPSPALSSTSARPASRASSYAALAESYFADDQPTQQQQQPGWSAPLPSAGASHLEQDNTARSYDSNPPAASDPGKPMTTTQKARGWFSLLRQSQPAATATAARTDSNTVASDGAAANSIRLNNSPEHNGNARLPISNSEQSATIATNATTFNGIADATLQRPMERVAPGQLHAGGVDGRSYADWKGKDAAESHSSWAVNGTAAAQWEGVNSNSAQAAAPRWPADGRRTPNGVANGDLSMSQHMERSAAPAQDFSTLHSYIVELEKEKFDLLQQIQQQHSTLHTLETQNQDMAEDYNKQGKQVAGLQAELARMQSEIVAQQEVLQQLSKDREGAKAAARETGDRAKVLAAEIVALEERQRKTRSAELRLSKEVEGLRDQLQQLKKRYDKADRDKAALQAMVNALQAEKKTLQSRARQSGGAGTPAASSVPIAPTEPSTRRSDAAEAATQTDAMQQHAATQWEHDEEQEDGTGVQHIAGLHKDAAAATDGDAPHRTGPTTSSRLTQLALTRHKQAVLTQLEAAAAAPGATGQRLLQVVGPQVLEMLPQALLAGGLEESTSLSIVQAVQSIDALLLKVEADKHLLMQAVQRKQADCHALLTANHELRQKLEMQTQRMELIVQQAMIQGGPLLWGPTDLAQQSDVSTSAFPGSNFGLKPDNLATVQDSQLQGQVQYMATDDGYHSVYATQQALPAGGRTPAPTPVRGNPRTHARRGLFGWMVGRRE